MQNRLARLSRGALAFLAATYWAASCNVPDFEFNLPDDAGTPDTSQVDTGAGGSPGIDVPNVFDCASDLDCGIYASLPICDVVARHCVECSPDNDTCPPGYYCSQSSTCRPGCTTDQDCTGAVGTADAPSGAGGEGGAGGQGGEGNQPGGGPQGALHCDTARNVCTGCTADSDCPLGTLCNALSTECVPGCTEERGCPSGFECCDGECANPQTSEEHCGGCGNACTLTGTVAACADGACVYGGCEDGFLDCNGIAGDGCEAQIATDPSNCGGCDQVCSPFPNAAAGCRDGACTVGRCNPGYADCGGGDQDGCETNILTSTGHCGGCNRACDIPNANSSCQASVCRITSCRAGFANCDGLASNGCEVDTNNDLNNCGGCGETCELANAMASCVQGSCQASECVAPNADCNGLAGDGCEVNTNTDPRNCGRCGTVCNLPNAVASCSNGGCTIASCNPGFGDCDGIVSNGCEANLNTNAQHCGECNAACSANNGTPSCALGACSISCAAGFANCDGSAGNGCEINTQLNVDHCNGCNQACSAAGGTPNCLAGVCGISSCTSPLADCDGNPANGCEVNTAGSVLHCGGCGKNCFVANGTAGCTQGTCNLASCTPGFADCNGFYEDGCEANLHTRLNCGACGQECVLPNAVATCATGTCEIQSCTAPFADCDGNPANGCETDTSTSVGHCGACGAACNGTNGSAFCSGGQCGIVCSAGFGNCNAAAGDGCETPLTNNVNACGACGTQCSVAHGQPTCNGTTCGVLSCTAPWADCDLQYATGCEVNTSSTVTHCGACGNACNATSGIPSCAGGNCSIACNQGSGNCDGNAANGCETNLNTSTFHCGACGNACTFANATPTCAAGSCALASCNDGFGNCNSQSADGCEVNLRTSVSHCGACGAACNLPNATAVCSGGACAIASCTTPWADCDGIASNGCETNLNTSTLHCGACGTVCNSQNGTPTCSAGMCGINCSAGFRNCDGLLTNGCEIASSSDVSNCGTCGNVCSAVGGTPNCVNGTCGISSCAPGLGDCDGSPANGCEVNLTNTATNCGACGTVCAAANGTAECVNSVCTIVGCNEGFANCNGLYSDGCEVNIRTTANCGACGVQCNLANASASCATGACQVVACTNPFGNCDNVNANGCETNTNTNLNNCGSCGNACSTVNGTPTCSAGTCSIACAAGFGNCDANAANGCETTLTNNVNACGSCTNVCAVANGTPGCIGTTCAVSSCTGAFRDCNGLYADGCEVNSNTSLANCGSCGNACNGTNGTASCALGACSISCNVGFGNCDANVGNGCEANLSTSLLHCGACGNACNFPNASAVCNNGTCQLGTCNAGFANCDGNAANGCETNITTTSNCGGCGIVCEQLAGHGSTTCSGGVCTPTCSTTWGNCDGNPNNGCETSIRTTTDCNGCGVVCDFANAAESCSTGVCTLGTCSVGFGNCDANNANGCETNTNTSIAHCGACNAACSSVNGTPGCGGGACTIACNSGFGNCDNNVANGCETNTSTSVSHCGTCGNACSFSNASAACFGGACQLGTCNAGFGNCDNNAANGCETNIQTLSNCGACGVTCSRANASASCTTGTCTLGTCNANFANCDGNATNGCETDLRTLSNCGTCGTTCSRANASASCATGTCTLGACNAGFGNCDANNANGCETALNTTANCGACGTQCTNANGTTSCVSGACTPNCAAGFASCDGNPNNGCERNINTLTDCGACGATCSRANASASCVAGTCTLGTCNAGFGNCDGNAANGCETALNTTANCGACGVSCSNANGTTSCVSGVCTPVCAGGFGDCDGNPNNGCETNRNTNVNHCGTCGNVCSATGGTPNCVNGTCGISSCSAGLGDCDGNSGNGCETMLTSLSNCGGCGTLCDLANASESCATGTCTLGTCSSGFGNCNGLSGDGCEINTQTSTAHCGACGAACSTVNGTAGCSLGACSITCNSGFGNCDANVANGCEAALNTTANCGTCGNVCGATNASPACTAGACVMNCAATFGNCDGNNANGCETSLRTNSNCNACGVPCSLANATSSCSTGTCSLSSCNSGFGNCDGNAGNGCETQLNTLSNCGTCGNVCGAANASPACTAGACVMNCASGFGNCDGNSGNGCETSTQTSLTNCGACGTACGTANGTASCSLGACSINCNAGFGNCDGANANGCETALNTTSNCGACGTSCTNPNGSTVCSSGVCSPTCSSGFGNCDSNANNGCEQPLTTLAHCGGCNTPCSRANATATCSTGSCAIGSCNSGFGNCDGNAANGCETALNTLSNCGTCGNVCGATNASPACTAGACVMNCSSGFGNCDGNNANGCETNTQNNASHCGACGNACSFANAGASCSAGSCQLGACNAGFGNCDGNNANGCEANTQTNASHCGACGNACTNPNGSTACSAGSCAPTCNSGFGNCDSNANNGCEQQLNTLTHCGGCNTACSRTNATATCSTGSCAIASCNAGFGNCDGNNANGCETNTQTSLTNCGACGTTCSSANGTASCSLSACQITCNAGFGNCDSNAGSNGCETNLTNNNAHCGACGNACGTGQTCQSGVCVGTVNVKAQLKNGDATWNSVTDAGIRPHIRLFNLGASAVALSELKIRYWYTRDSVQPQTSWCDYASLPTNCTNITGNFVAATPVRLGGEYYYEVGFTAAAGNIAAGANYELQMRFNKNDWSNYHESDDYSFDFHRTTFADWTRVTVYHNGVLVWGTEPPTLSAVSIASSSATQTISQPTANSHDGNESTRYASATSGGFPAITYTLTQPADVSRVRVLWYNGNTRTYPIQITVDNKLAFSGSTFMTTGYWEMPFPPVSGKTVTIAMTGSNSSGNSELSMFETQILGQSALFSDDFQSGNANNWTPSGGTWTVVTDGTLAYRSPLGSFTSVAGSSWTDMTVDAQVQFETRGATTVDHRVGLIGRNGGGNYYTFAVDGANNLVLLRTAAALPGSSGQCANSAANPAINVNAWVNMRMMLTGPANNVRLRTFLNGTPIHDCLTTSTTLASGNAGVLTFGAGTSGTYDDVRVFPSQTP